MKKRLLSLIITSSLAINAKYDPEKAEHIYKATRLALTSVCKGNFNKAQAALKEGAIIDYPLLPNQESPFFVAVSMNKEDIIDLFLTKNPNVNRSNAVGDTPLHYAVRARNLPLVRKLLAHGANPYLLNIFGTSPYLAACQADRTDMIVLLESALELYMQEKNKKPIEPLFIAPAPWQTSETSIMDSVEAPIDSNPFGPQICSQVAEVEYVHYDGAL